MLIIRSVPGIDKASTMQDIGEYLFNQDANRRKHWNSIHGSASIDCEYKATAEIAGLNLTNDFNLSAKMSAEAGDEDHALLQRLWIESGMAIELPFTDSDYDIQESGRNKGLTKPGIEIDVTHLFKPFTKKQAKIYSTLGYYIHDDDLYNQQIDLRSGIRIDGFIKKRTKKDTIASFISEIKTVKHTEFTKLETYIANYTKVLIKYQNLLAKNRPTEAALLEFPEPIDRVKKNSKQLMKQMMNWRDPFDGSKPKWGLLIYQNRNDPSKIIDVYVKFDETLAQELYLEMVRDRDFLNEIENGRQAPFGNTLPSKEECAFCPIHPVCPDPKKFQHIGLTAKANRERKDGRLLMLANEESLEELIRNN